VSKTLTRERASEMAAKSAAVHSSRVYLTRDEASALVDAYALLRSVARRSKVRELVADDLREPDQPAAQSETAGVAAPAASEPSRP
jgi:hypothetical protein